MKLELKHIAPYQEHKVKLIDHMGNKCNISYLSTKRIAFIDINGIGEVQKLKWEYATGKIKLILRPLSDLDKHHPDIFKEFNIDMLEDGIRCQDLNNCCYEFVQSLFERHYDVFGLIEQDLAIDINTL